MPVVRLDEKNSLTTSTYVDAGNASASYWSMQTSLVSARTNKTVSHALWKFDLGIIPNNAIINSAKLTFSQDSSTFTSTINMHKVTSNWEYSVTWNTKPTYDPNRFSTFTTSPGMTYEANMKDLVQEWVDGKSKNNGILLKLEDENPGSDNYINFYSFYANNTSKRPYLTIDYTMPTTNKKQVEYVGSSVGSSASAATSLAVTLPNNIQVGDLLIVSLVAGGTGNVTPPTGWSLKADDISNGYRHIVATKTAASTNEPKPVFSTTTNVNLYADAYLYRNVKSIMDAKYAAQNNTSAFRPPMVTATVNNTLCVAINSVNSYGISTFSPTLSYDMRSQIAITLTNFQLQQRYLYDLRQQTGVEMQAISNLSLYGMSTALVLEPKLPQPPTTPTNVKVDKSAYVVGDKFIASWGASTDPEGGAVTYDVQMYDPTIGGYIGWGTISKNTFDGYVPSMVDTNAAHVRVRAKNSKGEYSEFAYSSNFSVSQKDGQILAPVNVVSAAYLVSKMAPPVRLSNGWLVGWVIQGTGYVRYISKDNGKTWSAYGGLAGTGGNAIYIASACKGNVVYDAFVFPASNEIRITEYRNGVETILNTTVTVDSGQTSFSGVDLEVSPDGTKLWWAASTKNATYPSSFNLRAGSVPINADGTLGTPSAAIQITALNSATQNINPSINFSSDGFPVIVYQQTQPDYYLISVRKYNGSTWATSTIFQGGIYPQTSPILIRTPNGKLHAVWHGTDSSDSVNNYIRYSNSVVGAAWSTPKKLWSGKDVAITSDKNGKLILTYENGGNINRLESANEFDTLNPPIRVAVGTTPATLYDQTFQTDFTLPPTIFQTADAVKYYGSLILNKKPVATLTTPDNQTLTENATYDVAGNAVDEDAGNVVTVYYKINNGPPQAAASGVSDGSTPVLFAKTLTYKNKRVYLGATDITSADLAENVDHILTVWAEDNKQGKSTEVTRKFRVVWNRPPVISGENGDLGVFMEIPAVQYSAIDPEGNTFTFSEYLNGKLLRTFDGVTGRNYTVGISHDAWIRLRLDVQHQIKIVATDNKGLASERIYTFTRTETHIEFILNFDNQGVQSHFILDGMPERVLISLERYIPEGASIESVKVCNNALDASPAWEDATNAVKGGRGYLFTNKTKTAANWAINLWVILAKGTATERVRLNGYGGAFD